MTNELPLLAHKRDHVLRTCSGLCRDPAACPWWRADSGSGPAGPRYDYGEK
jgi:hypothetical protein